MPRTTPRSARARFATALVAAAALALPAFAAKSKHEKPAPAKEEGAFAAKTFAGLKFRSIGPALTSGRIADLAVDPSDSKRWIVAAASGGVWSTTNAGTTWTPLFDGQGSYSIGAVTIDPNNPHVLWVGTGENNSQRSVSFGDGVYLSLDAGKSWKNVGLGASEHIGRILVDPRDSDVVYVAAQGPLWSAGGDRGLYKTTDRGANWQRVLHVDDDTGISEVVLDPRDPDVLYAVAYQRRRHVWTLIDGGPGSGLYKSTDAGATWRKLTSGLPDVDLGRIGLAISPVDPDVLYAVVEAEPGEGGFFRSADRGESWEKRGKYVSGSPQYYQELFADPFELDRVYSMDTFLQVTDDAGASWRALGERNKHVDNHVIWIDPEDRDHYLVGCDGGLYESFDRGATWRYFENLPITQFYRVALDRGWPVYNVYGGTQDNFSLGGPSRTLRLQGPANEDWFVAQGGDGFWAAVDPDDPNIVYAEYQHGGLTRFDRKSGENVDIQPQAGAGEAPLRWNWDAPLVLSPHASTRLYFAANRLFRSDDRGDTWRAVSPDLTRQIDRNRLEVFGKVQRPEAPARGASTSFYGNIVALAESPRVEGLLYVGTDDGLIQVSENGGADWRRLESFPVVPAGTYVARLTASSHVDGRVYATFDNHKMADYRPYVLVSEDRGRTWRSIAGDLPDRGTVYALVEDPVRADLLFVGTEFGVYATVDRGGKWLRLSGGLPTVQVRDLAIQERESDLVLATFGRGFYVLDDYSALRAVTPELLEADGHLFDIGKAWLYVEGSRIGGRDAGFLGETFWTGENRPFGALFTYYLREGWESSKDQRRKSELETIEAGKQIEFPAFSTLRAEEREEDGYVVAVVTDAQGNVVLRLRAPDKPGIGRVVWDLRYPTVDPRGDAEPTLPWETKPRGPFVAPGTYGVALERVRGGEATPLGERRTFEVEALGTATLPAADRAAVLEFQQRTARLQRAVLGAEHLLAETSDRLGKVRDAIRVTPSLDAAYDARARALEVRLEELGIELSGDRFLSRRSEPTAPSVSDRVESVVASSWYATSEPTTTQRDAYAIAGEQFDRLLASLRALVTEDLPSLERDLERAGAPWTPGRVPEWKPEP
ncbi:MAG: glycosyl hydrolase [Acidobacteria bacterium]|nr:glycosyl hydrolase [Acidobacteriota bacterium]